MITEITDVSKTNLRTADAEFGSGQKIDRSDVDQDHCQPYGSSGPKNGFTTVKEGQAKVQVVHRHGNHQEFEQAFASQEQERPAPRSTCESRKLVRTHRNLAALTDNNHETRLSAF